MLVHLPGHYVVRKRAPSQGLLQFENVILEHFPNRTDTVFRISQEAEKQFSGTVSPAPAQPGEGGIHPVNSPDNGFDCIGKGQLLVVVGVNSDFLARAFQGGLVFINKRADLLGIEGSENCPTITTVDTGESLTIRRACSISASLATEIAMMLHVTS